MHVVNEWSTTKLQYKNLSNSIYSQAANITKRKRILIFSSNHLNSEKLKNSFSDRFNCGVNIVTDMYEAVNKMVDSVYDFIVVDSSISSKSALATIALANKSIDQEVDIPSSIGVSVIPFVMVGGSQLDQYQQKSMGHFRLAGCVPELPHMQHQTDCILRLVGI